MSLRKPLVLVSGNVSELPANDRIGNAINTQTGAAYTLAITDDHVEMNNAGANTLTVPPNSDVAFDIGTSIVISQYGAGNTTIAPGSGVTLRSRGDALKLAGQYAQAILTKRGTNEWYVSGDITV